MGILDAPALNQGTAKLRPGNRWAALGDSITKGADIPEPTTGLWRGNSWPSHASWITKQQAWMVRNAGVGGDTTAMMIARFAADVAAYSPSVVTIGGGTNDMTAALSFTGYQDNIKTLVRMVRQIRAAPVLCTIPPRTDNTYWQRIALWNAWLKQYAASEGIAVIDFNALLTDPATGTYIAAYSSGDGVHPSPAGYKAMGQLAATVLSAILPPWQPLLPVHGSDSMNLLSNSMFLVDANADGRGDNWNTTGTTTGTVYSLVSGDSAISGNWQKIDNTAGSANVGITQSRSGGISTGDIIAFCGRFDATVDPTISLNFTGTTSYARAVHNPNGGSSAVAGAVSGIFYVQKAVPAGCTGLAVNVTAGTLGVVKVAQIGLYNLTALGLV